MLYTNFLRSSSDFANWTRKRVSQLSQRGLVSPATKLQKSRAVDYKYKFGRQYKWLVASIPPKPLPSSSQSRFHPPPNQPAPPPRTHPHHHKSSAFAQKMRESGGRRESARGAARPSLQSRRRSLPSPGLRGFGADGGWDGAVELVRSGFLVLFERGHRHHANLPAHVGVTFVRGYPSFLVVGKKRGKETTRNTVFCVGVP